MFKKCSKKIKKRSTFFKKKAQLFSEAPYIWKIFVKAAGFFPYKAKGFLMLDKEL